MKNECMHSCQGFVCRLLLGAATMFSVLLLAAMAQGAVALLPGMLLLMMALLVMNGVCGVLAPVRVKAKARRVRHARAVGPAAVRSAVHTAGGHGGFAA